MEYLQGAIGAFDARRESPLPLSGSATFERSVARSGEAHVPRRDPPDDMKPENVLIERMRTGKRLDQGRRLRLGEVRSGRRDLTTSR